MTSNKLYIFKWNISFSLGYVEPIKARAEWHSEVLRERTLTGYNLPIVTLKIPQRDLVTSKGEGGGKKKEQTIVSMTIVVF